MSSVEIGWRIQLASETLPWSDDLSAALDAGDVVGTATCTLIDLLTGLAYPTGLQGTTSVSGSKVTQSVTTLTPGHNYRLTFNTSMGGGKIKASVVNLACPY